MTFVCARCGQPGPPFHVTRDCPKAPRRRVQEPELVIGSGHREPRRAKLYTPKPQSGTGPTRRPIAD